MFLQILLTKGSLPAQTLEAHLCLGPDLLDVALDQDVRGPAELSSSHEGNATRPDDHLRNWSDVLFFGEEY